MVGRGQGSLITLGMRSEVGTLAFAEYKAQMELCTAGKPSCALGAESLQVVQSTAHKVEATKDLCKKQGDLSSENCSLVLFP